MGILQILSIVRGRKRLFLTTLGSVVALVAAVSLLAPKEYVAELALVVDTKGSDPLTDAVLAPQLVPTYLATQAEIIRSRNVALKVIERMGLDRDRQVLARFRDAKDSDIRAWLVGLVLESLDAKTSRNSNIIRVSYASSDPDTAAAMANAFADAYIQTSLELQVDPARRQTVWFEQQVDHLREELAAAQARLTKYQSDHGVLGVDDARMDVENGRLQELSNQLVKVQAAMYDAETRREQLAGSPTNAEELPDLLENPLVQNLKSELARAEAKLAEIGARYDLNHPQYRSTLAEVTALRNKLNSEIGTVRGSVVQSAQIARRQVQEVQAALEEQKARIIALNQQRDRLAVMQRDVESARAAYDAALKQTNQTRLESRVDRTNIAILNQATAPLWPSSPRILLNIAVAFCAGLVLAIGLVLSLELNNRRLRSREDLLDWADLPLLAELPALPSGARPRLGRPPRPALELQTTA